MCRHLRHVARGGILLCITNLDGEHPSLALDERSLQRLTDGRSVDGGGHDEKAKVGAKELLSASGECESEVGMQAALVELVEDDDADAIERWVVLQHARQDTFGENLYLSVLADARVKADAVADPLSDGFAEQFCHAFRYLSGGKSARFEHQNLTLHGCIEHEGQRQQGRFAGSRRCSNDHSLLLPKRPAHSIGNRPSRQFT